MRTHLLRARVFTAVTITILSAIPLFPSSPVSLLPTALLNADAPRAAEAGAERSQDGAAGAGRSQATSAGCCGGEGDDKPHLLAGSYYTLKDGFTARLLLNNKGPLPVEVYPTLFSMSGERFDAPAVVVDPVSYRFVDFGEWAAAAGEQFREGSVQIFHRGKDLVLGTQIYLTEENHGLSFEEKLTELSNAA
jgi:hypothetical protein